MKSRFTKNDLSDEVIASSADRPDSRSIRLFSHEHFAGIRGSNQP